MEDKTIKNKVYRGGCPHCPGNEDLLSLDTVLYNGFGGYQVQKDGIVFYSGDPEGEWEGFKKLSNIEKQAKKSPQSEWLVILDNPLRGATWQRKGDKQWVLIETNLGFA